MTDNEIKMLWFYIAETWQQYEIPEHDALVAVRVEVWHDQLGDLDPRMIRAAIAVLAVNHWPPSVGEIRAKAIELDRAGLGEAPIPDVDEAFGEVMANVASVGYYGTPEWSHPAIDSVVRSFGWRDICTNTEPGVFRGQFVKLYESARGRHVRESHSLPPALAEIFTTGIKRVDDVLAIGEPS